MLNYMTRHLVALRAMPYAGQDLEPGDSFYATPDDERYFTRNGSARPAGGAPAPRQFVPAAAPIGETSTVVAALVLDPANAGASASVAAAPDAAPQTAAAESSQVPDDKASAKPVDQAAPDVAATARPAQAARTRTRLLTATGGEGSN